MVQVQELDQAGYYPKAEFIPQSNYEQFLEKGREWVDPEKSIFYNLTQCNSEGDEDGVKELLSIIHSDEPITSYEYVNFYVVDGFDPAIIGNKIIRDLLNRKTLTEKEADHLWKQVFFQDPKERRGKREIINKEDRSRILELIRDKEIVKVE
jgi:hypothetical protein